MTQMKDHAGKPQSATGANRRGFGRVFGRIFGFSIPATAVATATLAVVFAVALDGCSGKSRKTGENTVQSSPGQSTISVLPSPSPTPEATPAVAAKKKTVVKRPSTVTYNDSSYGVSFRYPRKYTLLVPEKGKQSEDELAKLPMNFTGAGGTSIAAVELKSDSATSFLKASVLKGMSQEQCQSFATADPPGGDTPIQTDDESGASKVSLRGLEFAKADEVTGDLEARYYHHFEPGMDKDSGSCYEFALGVSGPAEELKPVDDAAMFQQLERIFSTVKIKPEQASAVTAGVTAQPSNGTSPQ